MNGRMNMEEKIARHTHEVNHFINKCRCNITNPTHASANVHLKISYMYIV